LLGPFEHFLLLGKARGLKCNPPLVSMPASEDAGKILFARRARIAAHSLLKSAPLALPEPSETPRLSLVIPVHDNFEFTASLLLQISEVIDSDIEVIVVDDNSSDETTQLDSLVSNLYIVRSEVHLGFPKACNRVWRAARGSVVAFVNNDIDLGRTIGDGSFGFRNLDRDNTVTVRESDHGANTDT